jgi:hypothetical protein
VQARRHVLKGSAVSPSEFIRASAPGLVATPTTEANFTQVFDAIDNPQPLLVEGSTGCGKTAIITAVANAQRGLRSRAGGSLQFQRLNMSNRVSVEGKCPTLVAIHVVHMPAYLFDDTK